MPQHQLTEHIPLSTGKGYIPCSVEYRAALDARDAIHKPGPEDYFPRDLSHADRDRWYTLNGEMDKLHWQGGHLGATVFFEPPSDLPHGWLILKKREKSPKNMAGGDRDGQWRGETYYPLRYADQTGDNGEADLGLGYAIAAVRSTREGLARWATERAKPNDTEILLLACYPVDESAYVKPVA